MLRVLPGHLDAPGKLFSLWSTTEGLPVLLISAVNTRIVRGFRIPAHLFLGPSGPLVSRASVLRET